MLKRMLPLTAAVLALTLVLTLSGCGGNRNTEPTETETTTTETENTETNQSGTNQSGTNQNDPAAETSTQPIEDVDLAALADQMLSDAGITDTIPVSADSLASVYGIDGSKIVSSAAYNASANGAFPQEIVMIEATDEAAAGDIAAQLTSRLESIATQAASYDPDSLALAEKCSVITSGDYVGLFFSEHYDQLAGAFQSAVS